MALIDGLLQELEQEAQTTRRVLERISENQWPGGRMKRQGHSDSFRYMSRSFRAQVP